MIARGDDSNGVTLVAQPPHATASERVTTYLTAHVDHTLNLTCDSLIKFSCPTFPLTIKPPPKATMITKSTLKHCRITCIPIVPNNNT
jgi:hypothetical protein